jgi:AAA family ATP:ADP antiporter
VNAPKRIPPAPEPRSGGPIGAVLSVFNLRRGELLPVLLAGLMFFCILCGYLFIRPVREAFGIERGMSQLYSLFVATMVASLALSPIFSWLVGRFDRRIFLPIAYGSIVLMLVGFAFYRAYGGDEAVTLWTGRVFFVWLSVINLFMTGLFWSLMSDCFDSREAKRVFPVIAVGGTFGALLGSAFSWALAGGTFELFGFHLFKLDFALTAPQMMLVFAMFVAIAGAVAVVLTFIRPRTEAANRARAEARADRRSSVSEALDGMRLAMRSRYLLCIAAYIGLLAILATFLYFTQARVVIDAGDSESENVSLFASIAFWTQAATLLMQLLVTARLMRWIGIGWTMSLLPLVVLVGFGVLAFGEWAGWTAAAMFTTFTIVQATFSAGKYAVARPSRETLFTVLSRDEKYKAKSLIDTFVYRAGDTAGAGADAGLAAVVPALAVGAMMALAITVAPIAIVMAGLALSLGAQHSRRAAAGAPAEA